MKSENRGNEIEKERGEKSREIQPSVSYFKSRERYPPSLKVQPSTSVSCLVLILVPVSFCILLILHPFVLDVKRADDFRATSHLTHPRPECRSDLRVDFDFWDLNFRVIYSRITFFATQYPRIEIHMTWPTINALCGMCLYTREWKPFSSLSRRMHYQRNNVTSLTIARFPVERSLHSDCDIFFLDQRKSFIIYGLRRAISPEAPCISLADENGWISLHNIILRCWMRTEKKTVKACINWKQRTNICRATNVFRISRLNNAINISEIKTNHAENMWHVPENSYMQFLIY